MHGSAALQLRKLGFKIKYRIKDEDEQEKLKRFQETFFDITDSCDSIIPYEIQLSFQLHERRRNCQDEEEFTRKSPYMLYSRLSTYNWICCCFSKKCCYWGVPMLCWPPPEHAVEGDYQSIFCCFKKCCCWGVDRNQDEDLPDESSPLMTETIAEKNPDDIP